MTRVLVATSNPFWQRRRGSQQRIASLVEGLRSAGFDVEIAFAGRLPQANAATVAGGCRVNPLGVDPPNPPFDAPIDAFASDDVRAAFAEVVRLQAPDVIVVEYIRLAFLLGGLTADQRRATTLVLDTHDVIHQRTTSFHALGLPHWIDIGREQESRIVDDFDITVAIQEHDGREFDSMSKSTAVVVAPYAIEPRAVPRTTAAPTLGFIGVDGFHNRDALGVIINETWPRVLTACPAARLVVAGDVAHRCPPTTPHAQAIGVVDDVDAFHAQIDVLINPTRVGGGLKIKNAEALAAGRPVVTSTLGAQGFEVGSGASVFITDDPEAFASHAVDLLSDPEALAHAQAATHDTVSQHFNPRIAYAGLVDAIERDLAAKRSPAAEAAP